MFNKRLIFIIICLFFLFELINSLHFSRNVSYFVKNKKKKIGEGRFIDKLIKLTKIEPIPDLPEVPTLLPNRAIGDLDDRDFTYDLCHVNNLCLNGGICISHQNEFFCNCEDTHYGKTCEFKADKSKCEKNFCMNNSTCYSTTTVRQVPNFDFLKSRYKQAITMSVYYECWCQYKYEGSFCEFSESMRHCAEDKCNHHGIVKPTLSIINNNKNEIIENKECKCECEEFFSGDNCEIISPCRDKTCLNNGTCVVNEVTGKSECKCPTGIQLFNKFTTISGDLCEIIDFKGPTNHACFPCQGSFQKYYDCLKDRVFNNEQWVLNSFYTECENNNKDCRERLVNNDCFNSASCEISVGMLPLPDNYKYRYLAFLMPKCNCKETYDGFFCELAIRNDCRDETFYENDKSITIKKCDKGECRFNVIDSNVECKCDYGYRGLRCSQKDPCIPNPCVDSVCVEFPLSDTFSDSDLKHTCICNTTQDVDEEEHNCVTNDYEECFDKNKQPYCKNNGTCYPCSMDTTKELALCNEDEKRRKFRCICNLDFKPPFCNKEVSPCDTNQCQNDGKCVPVEKSNFDYNCICKQGYTGTFCHTYLGICVEKGNEICLNGKCLINETYQRGFACDCKNGFIGSNCEIAFKESLAHLILAKFEWFLPFLAFLASISLSFLIVIYNKFKKNLRLKKLREIAED